MKLKKNKKKKISSKKRGEQIMGKMEIKISELKTEIKKLNSLIENYEEIYLNFYNVVNDGDNYWKDDYADLFYEEAKNKKTKIRNFKDELDELKHLYELIVAKYEYIATRNIIFDFTNKDSIYSQIDNCINMYQNIISSYSSLDTSVCEGSELSNIMNSQSKLREAKEKLTKYKLDLIKTINYIEKTELEINHKISSITLEILNIEKVDDFVFKKYKWTTGDRIRAIDKEKLKNNQDKVTMHKGYETLKFDEINIQMTEILENYKTANYKKISDLNFEYEEKITTINTIHNNYIDILDKTIEKYLNTGKDVYQTLSNIDKNELK